MLKGPNILVLFIVSYMSSNDNFKKLFEGIVSHVLTFLV